MATEHAYPCPCCGYMTFDQPPGSYSLCGVCDWEDDNVQLAFPLAGGANEPLAVCQSKFLAALSERRLSELQSKGYKRCPDWRPLQPSDLDQPGASPASGREYFEAMATVEPRYYWDNSRAIGG